MLIVREVTLLCCMFANSHESLRPSSSKICAICLAAAFLPTRPSDGMPEMRSRGLVMALCRAMKMFMLVLNSYVED